MPYRGHIQDGAVVLDEPAPLPDGTEVRVEPVDSERRPTLAERFRDVIGTVPDLPSDMAENHDRYVHGTRVVMRSFNGEQAEAQVIQTTAAARGNRN